MNLPCPKIWSTVSAIALTTLLFSCNKEPDPYTTDSCLTGYVDLQDEYSRQGVTVKAFGPYGENTAVTDSSGWYFLKGLGNGTYRVEFSIKGYAGNKIYGVQLFGHDTAYAQGSMFRTYEDLPVPQLGKVYTYQELEGFGDNSYAMETNLSNTEIHSFVFLGTSNNVSCSDYQWMVYGYGLLRAGFDHNLIMFYFYDADIASGTKLYVRVYPGNNLDPGYLDLNSGKWTYPTLITSKPSNVVSFVMP